VSGQGDRAYRRPEPSFARAIARALGGARSVLEIRSDDDGDGVGSGSSSGSSAGSYAPADADVTTTAPSAIAPAPPAQPTTAPPAPPAPAARLPVADDAFDAALATFSLDAWDDLEHGLAELRRVTRGPIVVLTLDPARVERSWLAEYAPEVVAADARRHPSLDRITAALGVDDVTITPLPIPFTCVDGFSEAYYARPERLLDSGARRADPAWGLVDEMTARRSVAALRTALESGEWDRRHGALRIQPSYVGSLVLLTAEPRRRGIAAP